MQPKRTPAAMARSISARAISGFVRAVRYSAGTPARSNRARLLVQLSGRNSRKASMTGTSPRASVSDTRVWQLAVLPSAEAYCAATPTECVPFLGIAVSSITRTASLGESAHLVVAFRRGLSETGYVEGQNVHVSFRCGEVRSARLPALEPDLVEQRVAVIVANGPSALTAKAATATIPIVFLSGADPINAGLVTSFNRPRENMTGVSWFSAELGAKRLGLLHELVPKAAVFSLLVNPEEQQAGRQSAEVQAAARSIGGQLHIVNASTEKEIDSAFAALVQQRTNALIVAGNPFFTSRRDS